MNNDQWSKCCICDCDEKFVKRVDGKEKLVCKDNCKNVGRSPFRVRDNHGWKGEKNNRIGG